ncbi:unnamed protein product [Adineta ricciae]|uniref:Uncharacterized protein n=1 Tax=Adineta ricciae TaxID=249248 RepID=A0A814NYJ6_ADIRI|nr:unnamed protein product [Adineta ricciae]
MPNNCSTIIKRKKDMLNQILRSNSDGKLQDDIIETTAELRISGARKTSAHGSPTTPYRSNFFPNNRVQPASTDPYDTHLPTIRYTKGNVDRHHPSHDEYHSRGRPKTPLVTASPKSSGCTPSASISSIFNAFGKRSTENLMSPHGEFEEIISASPTPLSRRSQRASKRNGINQNIILSQRQLTDSGVDFRFSSSSGDTNQHSNSRPLRTSSKPRVTPAHIKMDSSRGPELLTRERTNHGQLYQRRTNNTIKTPTKQKIDKYRRRSEEVIQAAYGHPSTNSSPNNALCTRPKPPPPTPTPTKSHRVASNADIEAHLKTLRLSINPNLPQTVEPSHNLSHPYPSHRIKSPYLYPPQQQLVSAILPTSNPPTPLVRIRRSQAANLPTAAASSSQHHHQSSFNQSTTYNPGNLYLAFIASRHMSTVENHSLESDPEQQKLMRILNWIEKVEEHRRQQSDHDKLIIEQNRRMETQEDDLSLYSELQFAVDDLPANTSGQPCERIVTIDFDK